MSVALNHTIVASHDQDAGAAFLTEILGLAAPTPFGPFTVVEVAHGTSLDYLTQAQVSIQHYAFLVGDDEFEPIMQRLRERGVPTYADPGHRSPGENDNDGGRGAYFPSPEGHNLEILTGRTAAGRPAEPERRRRRRPR